MIEINFSIEIEISVLFIDSTIKKYNAKLLEVKYSVTIRRTTEASGQHRKRGSAQ